MQNILEQAKADHEINQKNFILNSIGKMRLGFLLSLMCMFPESNETKFWSHSLQLGLEKQI